MELENYTLSLPGLSALGYLGSNRIPGALPQADIDRAPLALSVRIPYVYLSATRILTFIPRTSTMTFMHWRLFTAVLFASTLIVAAEAQDGPKNAVLLIIRHAENPASGHGLSPTGEQRAKAYKDYFLNFTVDSKRLEPGVILVADDSKHSHRPRLTVEPFAKAAKLPIDSRFSNNQPPDLAAELRANHQGKVILVCWHHGQIPALLRAL